jgi:DNA-binding NarL/FixJ family response regulator
MEGTEIHPEGWGLDIVVCDDHLLLADCLAAVLDAQGHRVLTATDPDAAVRLVANGGVDVCVMDLSFPGATGFDAIREITLASPATRVVVLSGSAHPFARERALAAGAAAFVVKGEDVGRLIEAVEAIDRIAPENERRVDIALTAREREVLDRLVSGERTQMIADGMGVSYSTARTHVRNLLRKLGVHSRLEAVALAMSHSLVSVDGMRSEPLRSTASG